MMLFPKRQLLALGLAIGIGFGATTAYAGLQQPDLQINWWVDGAYVGSLFPGGTYSENFDWWTFSGFETDFNTGVSLNYNLNADPDPLISGNLTVENPFLASVDVVLEVILPTAVMFNAGTELSGSAALGLTTNSDGGTLSSIGGDPVWQGLIDGAPVGNSASMFFDPFELHNDSIGSSGASANFGLPVGVPGPPLTQSIGIRIAFNITQGDQASITSGFNVIPAPAGLALLGVGALGARRRRRR